LDFFERMKCGKIQLLDIIVEISGKPVKTDKLPQECLDVTLGREGAVELGLYRPPYALSKTGELISSSECYSYLHAGCTAE